MAISPLKNMLTDSVGVKPTNTAKTPTADNSQPIAQKEVTAESSKNFANTLGKKITTKTPQEAPADKKGKKQTQNSEPLSKIIDHDNSLTAQELLTSPVVLDKPVNVKEALNQPPVKTPQPIPGSKAVQTPSLSIQTAKSITSEPDQIVPETTKPSNKPIQPTTDQSQIKSEIILPDIPDKSLISSANPEKASDTGKMQVFDKALVSEGPKTLETTKPVITSIPPSNQQNQQISKELIPTTVISDNKIAADSEQSAIPNKSLIPDSPKPQLSNAQFAAADDQSSRSQQKVSIGQESPAPAVEQTISNKADTDQKDHHGKMEFFESPKKDKAQLENPPVKSNTEKISQPQTQPTTPQAGIRNNTFSNQPSNPNMELGEQVLVGGNVQPETTEPSPASTAFAKIAGNTDSGANVSSQIQESIQSSFQSGSQQIVIRLNPPELGKVAIKFTEQGGEITGLLQVDKVQTKDQLQQALPEIIQNLQGSGIQIKRIEVVLTNQQEQYTSKDQSSTAGQDGFSGQQSSPNSESQRNNTTYNEWLTKIDNVAEYMEPQVQFADNSINMLV